jgi:excisionase family DNA binding protein
VRKSRLREARKFARNTAVRHATPGPVSGAVPPPNGEPNAATDPRFEAVDRPIEDRNRVRPAASRSRRPFAPNPIVNRRRQLQGSRSAIQLLPLEGLLNVEQAAHILGISVKTLRARVLHKKIEYVKIGGRVLFHPLQLQLYIQRHIVKARG